MSPRTPMRLPRNRGSKCFKRGTEWTRGLVMRAGRTLATYSGGPPQWWLLRAASRESRRELDKRANRRRISTRFHLPKVPLAFYTLGRRECRARIWESPRFLLPGRANEMLVGTLPTDFNGQQPGTRPVSFRVLPMTAPERPRPVFLQVLYKRARQHQN